MQTIATNSKEFVEKIQQGYWIECNNCGQWWTVGFVRRWIRWLREGDQARIDVMTRTFTNFLDHLEKSHPTLVKNSSGSAYINCGTAILKQTESKKNVRSIELAAKVIALKYRMGSSRGGIDPVFKGELREKLQEQALVWKGSQALYVKKELTEKEKERLAEVCRYEEYVNLLLKNESAAMRDVFFKWVLRDGGDVDAIVQFPNVVARLRRVYLHPRLGHFGVNIYEDKKDSGKDCTIPIEVEENGEIIVKRYSLLNENQEVVLRNNYRLTIAQIFADFKKRTMEPGNFEFLGRRLLENGTLLEPALINYNSLQCGSYDANTKSFKKIFDNEGKFESQKNGLPKQILPLDIVTKEQLEEVYGKQDIPQNGALLVRRATRENTSLDFVGCHAFSDLIVPEEGDKFAIYSFGKYTDKWPQTIWQKLTFLGSTHKARLASPDENQFYSHRQHAMETYVLNEEETKAYIQRIVNKLRKSEEGNWYYQFLGKNCAYDVDRSICKINKDRETVFEASLGEVQPTNKGCQHWFQLMTNTGWVGKISRKISRFFLGTWAGIHIKKKSESTRTFKSVSRFPQFKDDKIFLPSKMFGSTLENRRVIFGNCFAVQN